jgi:histidine triad (HIT) family protein
LIISHFLRIFDIGHFKIRQGGPSGSPQTRNEPSPPPQAPQAEEQGTGGQTPEENIVSDCLFCKIVSRAIPSQVVLDTDEVFAFRDVHPQAPQHVLLVPKRHIEKLADLTASDSPLVGKLLTEASRLARELGMDSQGYRVVINNGETAGQSVWHLHIHLLSGRPFGWPPG